MTKFVSYDTRKYKGSSTALNFNESFTLIMTLPLFDNNNIKLKQNYFQTNLIQSVLIRIVTY